MTAPRRRRPQARAADAGPLPARFRPLLIRLDALLLRELERLRRRHRLSLEELRGLTLSDAYVEALLTRPEPPPSAAPATPITAGGDALDGIAAACGLGGLDRDLLLLALAPELDPRYAAVYAFLNDDLTRRWPCGELALRLLGRAGGLERILAALSPAGALATAGLLAPPPDPAEAARPLLHRALRAHPVLVHHALGMPGFAVPGLAPGSGAGADAALLERLAGMVRRSPAAFLVLSGPPGVGRAALAAALAARLGDEGGLAPLHLDPAAAAGGLAAAFEDARLTARLTRGLLAVAAEEPPPEGWAPRPPARGAPPVAILTGAPREWLHRLARHGPVHHLSLPVPGVPARAGAWRAALAARGMRAGPAAVRAVAGRFRLTPGRIAQAAERLAAEGAAGPAPLGVEALGAAARGVAEAELHGVARRLPLQAGWGDLVLPAGALRQLRDLAGAIDARGTVLDAWGFARVGRATGRGLAALFSGGSGTGKTMSAGVVARAAGLDLWRIDLSGLVSKYIGETEKNLERVFRAAEATDAILLFDEADAIFGRRSEVKDAHDRYANIEIAYLLQRLEDHDGVVILATNLSRNLDTAFLRRLHSVVEFPMPDAAARARLWRKAFPPQAPLSPEADLAELGRRHALSGGDIRAAALEAALLAAQAGGGRGARIGTAAIETAVARQLLKRGLVVRPPAGMPAAPPRHPGNGLAAGGAAAEAGVVP